MRARSMDIWSPSSGCMASFTSVLRMERLKLVVHSFRLAFKKGIAKTHVPAVWYGSMNEYIGGCLIAISPGWLSNQKLSPANILSGLTRPFVSGPGI